MNIQFNSLLSSGRGNLVKAGDVAKAQFTRLTYNRAMESLLGHSDRDLLLLSKNTNNSSKVNVVKSFSEGVKSFFEKGCMF